VEWPIDVVRQKRQTGLWTEQRTLRDRHRQWHPAEYLKLGASDDLHRAASYVLSQNLVHGDALTMRTHDGQAITFAEWGYLGKGKFQRRDFRLDTLTLSSTFSAKGSLFAHLGRHELFTPTKDYPSMTVSELAAATLCDAPREAV